MARSVSVKVRTGSSASCASTSSVLAGVRRLLVGWASMAGPCHHQTARWNSADTHLDSPNRPSITVMPAQAPTGIARKLVQVWPSDHNTPNA